MRDHEETCDPRVSTRSRIRPACAAIGREACPPVTIRRALFFGGAAIPAGYAAHKDVRVARLYSPIGRVAANTARFLR